MRPSFTMSCAKYRYANLNRWVTVIQQFLLASRANTVLRQSGSSDLRTILCTDKTCFKLQFESDNSSSPQHMTHTAKTPHYHFNIRYISPITYYLKLSKQAYNLKCSQVITHIKEGLKNNILETCTISIMRNDVTHDHHHGLLKMLVFN